MRLCIISSYPPAKDGVSYYCAKLCQAMMSVCSKLQILVLSNESYTRQDGVKAIKGWNTNSIFFPFTVFRIVENWKPEVIHIQHEYQLYGRGIYSIAFPLLLLILRFSSRPIVVTMHHVILWKKLTSSFFHRHNLGKYFTTIKKLYVISYTKLIGLLASKITVHLEVAANILVKDYSFKENKVLVIPHGVDVYTENLSAYKLQAKERLNLQNKKVLLFFGQIRRGKGLEHFIKAMPKIISKNPQSISIIAGYYNPHLSPESRGYLDELMALLRSLGLEGKVVFREQFIQDDDVPVYFAAADVVLLPYTEDEIVAASGPLSTALALSKPIVATKIKRFTEYLKDGENALLVQPADSDGLADAVNMLVGNEALSRMLSKNIEYIVIGKSWKDVAFITLAVYGNLVLKHGKNYEPH